MPDYEVVGQRLETEREAERRRWFEKVELESPEALASAARTLLSLITALLSVLFAVLAVAGNPLPAYLQLPGIRASGVVVVMALLVSLVGALQVVLPRPIRVRRARLDEQRDAFAALLAHKSDWLTLAVWAFGVALVALGAVLMVGLLCAS
jgi:uncharacterized integral membrane protein